MVIYHPMTKDKKILQGFDKEAMVEFMVSKLPSTTLPLITDNNEKPLDSTKNPETIVLAQNTPSHPITTVQNTANIPSIAEKQRLEAS